MGSAPKSNSDGPEPLAIASGAQSRSRASAEAAASATEEGRRGDWIVAKRVVWFASVDVIAPRRNQPSR
jgi:hypothetical protein